MLNRKTLSFLLLFFIQQSNADSAISYRLDSSWPKLPVGTSLGQSSGIGIDSHNHVFIFHRSGREWSNNIPTDTINQNTVSMFDGKSGELLKSWGANRFVMPHGLSVDGSDNIWLSDAGTHQVHKFTHDGELLLSLGEAGIQGKDKNHFARPTDIGFDDAGKVYITDGYLNTRVMVFTDSGHFTMQWGKPGSMPGEFNLPHSIDSDQSYVYVADRDNARVQVFSHDGSFMDEYKGEKIGRPFAIVALNKEIVILDGGDFPDKIRARVVILNENRQVSHSFNAGLQSDKVNLGHDIAADTEGNFYVVDIAANRVSKFLKIIQ